MTRRISVQKSVFLSGKKISNVLAFMSIAIYPFKGHLFGSLQMQCLGGVFSSVGVFCLRMVLLCPSMMPLKRKMLSQGSSVPGRHHYC